jgi:hypothetical protein
MRKVTIDQLRTFGASPVSNLATKTIKSAGTQINLVDALSSQNLRNLAASLRWA